MSADSGEGAKNKGETTIHKLKAQVKQKNMT